MEGRQLVVVGRRTRPRLLLPFPEQARPNQCHTRRTPYHRLRPGRHGCHARSYPCKRVALMLRFAPCAHRG